MITLKLDLDQARYLHQLLISFDSNQTAFALSIRLDQLLTLSRPDQKPCHYCHKTTRISNYGRESKYCSDKCRQAAYRQRKKG